MNDPQHPDPAGEAAAQAAQLAAMTLSAGEALARLHSQRLHDQAARDERDAAATRAAHRAYAAESAAVYRQALKRDWVRTSPTDDLIGAWRLAEPYFDTDPTARIATDRVEERLRDLHPEAMTVFDSADLRIWPASERMQHVVQFMRGPYGLDPVGTSIHPHPKASSPAATAFPASIDEAMQSAPTAATRAVRAITAGPVRKQLTATPHQPGRRQPVGSTR